MRKNRVIEQNRCYHLVSRLAHRAFFLDDEEKDRAVALMRRAEAGVQADPFDPIASAVGIKNISVVIAPYDMRNGRKPELERSPLKWYPGLCREIETALGKSDVNGGHLFFTTNERPGYCSVPSIERNNP